MLGMAKQAYNPITGRLSKEGHWDLLVTNLALASLWDTKGGIILGVTEQSIQYPLSLDCRHTLAYMYMPVVPDAYTPPYMLQNKLCSKILIMHIDVPNLSHSDNDRRNKDT